MLLKQAAPDVEEGVEGELLDDVGDALRGDRRFWRVDHGELEDGDELREGRLVHDVDRVHFRDQEVQHRPAVGDGAELLARGCDPQLRVSCVPQLLLDFGGGLLGDVEHIDDLWVIQQRSRAVSEAEEEVVLQLHDLLLVRVHLFEEFLALLLKLRLLLRDHSRQQLVLQTLHGDCKVDDGDARGEFWGKVRIRHSGRDEQLERLRLHINLLIPELDDALLPLSHKRLVEHGVEKRVKLLLDIREEHRFSVREAVLQVVPERLVGEVGLDQTVLGFFCARPRQTLALRIDHDRVARGARRQNPVLH
mmetsp:Transcript_53702/g.127674  ORF Transcript_53702/g.127674 Transcript_53702/m.127674 type:complete len:306 (+) Transcript_53702:2456-3373(+)